MLFKNFIFWGGGGRQMHNTAHSPLHQSKNLNLLACIKQIKPGCTSAMVDNCIPKSSKMND